MSLVRPEPLRADVLDPRNRAEAKARVAAERSAVRAVDENIKAVDADCAQAAYRRRKVLSAKLLVTPEELDWAQSIMRRNEARLRSANVAVEVA